MKRIILVAGATGRQGGAAASHLLKTGWNVRALTRLPEGEKAIALQKEGIEVVRGDLNDPLSLRSVLNGVYGVFSVQNSWEHGVEREIRQGMNLADAASWAGVVHFVYSSVGSAHQSTGIPHFESKWEIEQYIRATGLRSTILRPVFFMENLLTTDTLSSIDSGSLPLGLDPEKPLQMIAVNDIGALTALAFNNPLGYVSRSIDIAGDELTGLQMATILSKTLEQSVQYRQTPVEHIRAFSDDYAAMVEWFNIKGYKADISALRKLHPALTSFEKWAIEHKPVFEAVSAPV